MSASRNDLSNDRSTDGAVITAGEAGITQSVKYPVDRKPQPELRISPAVVVANTDRQSDMRKPPLPARTIDRDSVRDWRSSAAERSRSEGSAADKAAAASQRQAHDAQNEIVRYLATMQESLKTAVSEEVAREIGTLRAEIRRSDAEDRHFAASARDDLANLADSIGQLSRRTDTESGLAPKIAEIRLLIDGLARESSMQNMEACWERVEGEIDAIGAESLHKELAVLGQRTEEIKRQLGAMDQGRAIEAFEGKLGSLAAATEQIASAMKPANRELVDQMSTLTSRLESINRLVSGNGRGSALSATDTTMIQRLENRVCSLSDKIDLMSSEVMLRQAPVADLGAKIDRLANRIDQMQAEPSASLNEKLDMLSRQMDRALKSAPQLEVSRHLATLAKKIDALDKMEASPDCLAEKLDYLARRLDEVDMQGMTQAPDTDEMLVARFEGRLSDLANGLVELSASRLTELNSTVEMERQIKGLTGLLAEMRGEFSAVPAEIDRRITTMEALVTVNDEFVVEAAHRAAQTVMDSYSFDGATRIEPAATTAPALSAVMDELRNLEDVGKIAGERTHRTFEALHETLVKIAERLLHMEDRMSTAAEKHAVIVAELLDEMMRTEAAAGQDKEKPKSGLLANIGRRFSHTA